MSQPFASTGAGASVTDALTIPGLREIRLVGRGGQGVVTAGELLGRAVVDEGRHAQSLPTFGPERRGALSTATLRVSPEQILLKCTSARPDVVLVIDPTIWHHANVLLGVREGATLIFNSAQPAAAVEAALRSGQYGTTLTLARCEVLAVDGTSIALTHLGRPIPNTAMMGALAGAVGLVGQAAIEAVLSERFGAKAEANIAAARAARAALAAQITTAEA